MCTTGGVQLKWLVLYYDGIITREGWHRGRYVDPHRVVYWFGTTQYIPYRYNEICCCKRPGCSNCPCGRCYYVSRCPGIDAPAAGPEGYTVSVTYGSIFTRVCIRWIYYAIIHHITRATGAQRYLYSIGCCRRWWCYQRFAGITDNTVVAEIIPGKGIGAVCC